MITGCVRNLHSRNSVYLLDSSTVTITVLRQIFPYDFLLFFIYRAGEMGIITRIDSYTFLSQALLAYSIEL